jgi:hypothetical protein
MNAKNKKPKRRERGQNENTLSLFEGQTKKRKRPLGRLPLGAVLNDGGLREGTSGKTARRQSGRNPTLIRHESDP